MEVLFLRCPNLIKGAKERQMIVAKFRHNWPCRTPASQKAFYSFELLEQFAPRLSALPVAVNDSQQLLSPVLKGTD